MRHTKKTVHCLLIFAVCLIPASAFGQALADRVPADAIVYVGWNGSQSLGTGYQNSNLRGFLADSQLPEFAEQFLPRVLDKIAEKQPDAKAPLELLRTIAGPLWRHPSAFFVVGVDLNGPNGPSPKVGLLCDAGSDADALERQLKDIVKLADGAPFPIRVVRKGSLVAWVTGYEKGEDAIAGGAGGAKGLASDADFTAALGKVSKDGVLTGYIHFEKLVEAINDGITKAGPPELRQMWPNVKQALGLGTIKRVVFSSGFAGKDWETRIFVAAPEPRRGLLGALLISGKPLSNEIFTLIPQNATIAGAGFFDPAGLISVIREVGGQIEPSIPQTINDALADVSKTVGVDVEKDFLGSLGDEWAYYVDPTVIGRGMMGTTIVNRLKNPAKFEQSLVKLQQFANSILAQQLSKEGITLAFRDTTSGNLTIHYLAVPLITPAWAVQNGNLYIALYPQVVSAGAAQALLKGKSILENPAFVAVRKRLGDVSPDSIQFVDLPKLAPDAYGSWVAISRLDGIGDMFGIQSPAMLLPPLSKTMQYLSASGQVTWTDAEGAHLRAISPFPGSEALGTDPMSMGAGQQAMMISVLLPALQKAREQASRVKSANNLRQIGLGALMYANAQPNGALPRDLGTLAKEEDLTPQLFVNPRKNDGISPSALAAPKDKQAAWINENADYLWFGAGHKNTIGAQEVMASEKPEGLQEGLNILFGDGHVEFVVMGRAMQMVNDARGHGLR